jgi:DNA (cytosine-5)-methyltransferase 1
VKKENLTMIELFSGIGAQIEGTNMSGLFNTTVIATSDIEKDAMVSYAAMHEGLTKDYINEFKDYPCEEQMKKELLDKNIGFDFKKGTNPIARMKGDKLKKYYLAMVLSNNLGDISKIQELPLADFWTYSFPCQDISVAGNQAGIIEGETRSGLLYEVERLLVKAKETDTLPKYLLLENVKNLVGKQFIEQFNEWISTLEELGFNTYHNVINAKNCGVPQNRERVFAVSIRKDIDKQLFTFPKAFDLGYRLRDFLEDEVDEKYYLSQEIQDRLQITDETFTKSVVGTTKPDFRTIGQRDLVFQKDGIMGALVATDYKQPKQILEIPNELNQSMTLSGGKWDKINESCRRVYSENGIAPTLHTCGGGNTEPKVVFEERRDEGVRLFKGDYIGTLRTIDSCGDKRVAEKINGKTAVRKLTPRESYRLMGFSDKCYDKALELGLSDSAGYKQAGNSIVTTCIMLLMEHLYKAQYDNEYICFDENFIRPQVD